MFRINFSKKRLYFIDKQIKFLIALKQKIKNSLWLLPLSKKQRLLSKTEKRINRLKKDKKRIIKNFSVWFLKKIKKALQCKKIDKATYKILEDDINYLKQMYVN